MEKDRLGAFKWLRIDVALKVVGLILTLTVFPPASSIAVLITLCVLVIPNQMKVSEGEF